MALLILSAGCGAEPRQASSAPTSRNAATAMGTDSARKSGDSAAPTTPGSRADSSRPVASGASSAARGTGGNRKEQKEDMFRGAYRRTSTASEFWPCGSKRGYDVIGRSDALVDLRERFRWNSVWLERPLYAVFLGAMVEDTSRARSSSRDSGRTVETRFFLARLDTVRTWQPNDCGGVRPIR